MNNLSLLLFCPNSGRLSVAYHLKMKILTQQSRGMGSFTSVPALLAIACLMLCGRIAQAQTPVISNISPNGAYQFQSANALTFTASSSVGIAPTSIAVQLMGTNLLGQAFSNMLTTANGLVVTGTSTSRSVSAALASNTVYITIILVTNTSLRTASSTVSFDTINPAYTFEAEDYDYNSGHYFDNPQTNAYRNLNAIDGVDAHNQNLSRGASAYRASGFFRALPRLLCTMAESGLRRKAA